MVRRHGDLQMRAWTGYDLDSLAQSDLDWRPTRDAWKGQDVGYQTLPTGKQVVGVDAAPSVAPLKLASSYGYQDCVDAPYNDVKVVEPNIERNHAFCVRTSEGRYALLQVKLLTQADIQVEATVWE
ncbi:hypothetical protein DQ384_08875 [Sphaerisporangium album]|uniref:Uncharacterized protein n=1 Tax=Sphaerisporangium album TaxID=509200 RepID=A0A367FP35_9ACTN|nr:hypothetical protein DQ384_08875 [Sphaerisporangium album]